MSTILYDKDVKQGDLVFINHITKPAKSGWWRKLNLNNNGGVSQYYVLEKPVHIDFDNMNDTRSNNYAGTPIMKASTLRDGCSLYNRETINLANTSYNQSQYDILFIASGASSAVLPRYDYDLSILTDPNRVDVKKDIKISDTGNHLLDILRHKFTDDPVQNLAYNMR